jgi:hypothetical protein
MEVIEHVDPPRLPAVAASVFGHARPTIVIVTTPERGVQRSLRGDGRGLAAPPRPPVRVDPGRVHRWCTEVAGTYGYGFELTPVGDHDPEVGSPTQLATFTLETTP